MAGRKSVYDTQVKSRFAEIGEWVKSGATERSIAQKLGIAYSTFNKYKAEKPEFAELLHNNRAQAVEDIENAMYKAAVGGIQQVTKGMKVKVVEYQDGKRASEYEDVVPYTEEVYLPPNVTAAIFLLKHWAKDRGYTNDPQTLELKKQEFEHKKRMDEQNSW